MKLFRLHMLGHNHLINDYAIDDYVMLWKTPQLSYTLILAIEIHLGGQSASMSGKKAM